MTAARLLASTRPSVIAHRGDSSRAPENTLAAFRAALDCGVDAVELDYRHSADGVPHVMHDAALNRTTNAQAVLGADQPIAATPASQLTRLDAGGWFGERFQGEHVPTLEESLRLLLPSTITLIERKAGDPQTCAHLLADLDARQRVVVLAYDWSFLARLRDLDSQISVAALGKGQLSNQRLQEAEQLSPDALIWRHGDLDQGGIAKVQAGGFPLWSFTVNDCQRALHLVEVGVSGIITDRPAELAPALKSS